MAGGAGGLLGSRAGADLLERQHELSTLLGRIDAAATGTGSVVLVEGAAGIGKSRLLAAVAAECPPRVRVVPANCRELEAALPWWLARSMLSPLLAEMSPGRRRRTLERAGDEAVELLGGRDVPEVVADPTRLLRRVHALTWLVSDLAEDSPLALLVDDLHWADEPSQHFLAYLAGRAHALPLALLVAQRPPQPGPPAEILGRLTSVPGVEMLALAPLTSEGVTELVRCELGQEISAEAQAAVYETTGGNPLFVRELSRTLADRQAHGLPLDPEAVRGAAPSRIVRSVRARLAGLGDDAVALARSVAVFGSGAGLARARELAGLAETPAEAALERLAAEQILLDELPLRFAHPLVASAVYEDLGVVERGRLHLLAARILSSDGCEATLVAAHLPRATRAGDPWVVQTLRQAAVSAVAQGAARLGLDYLARALEEPPGAAERLEVLSELACLGATLGSPDAPGHLRAALDLTERGSERARLLLELGRYHLVAGDPPRARRAFEEGEAALGEPSSELGSELRAAWWMAAFLDSGAQQRVLARETADVEETEGQLTRGQRQMLAQLAQQRAFGGGPRAELRALALRAWGDGELLREETSDGLTWSLVTGTLLVADELELELEICDAVLTDARTRGSPMGYATASYCRSWPRLHRGQVVEAAADAEAALDARRDGWRAYVGCATAVYAAAMAAQGALAPAREALTEARADPQLRRSGEFCFVLWADGLVLLAEDRPGEALDLLLQAGEGVMALGVDQPGMIAWRSDAAIAAAGAGDAEQAAALAGDALSVASASGVSRAIAAALRARSRTEPVEDAIRSLQAAADALTASTQRLETVHVLLELGAALRRANRRADARRPLTEALGLARRAGLRSVTASAETELAAAGIRVEPRRRGDVGVLTPSERRVALTAAEGHSNREIAQMLFVTVKTVEYHLGNTYSKLGIKRRGQLAGALADELRAAAGP